MQESDTVVTVYTAGVIDAGDKITACSVDDTSGKFTDETSTSANLW